MSTREVDRLNAVLSGRYSVQRELGRGGMATVYLAETLSGGEPVALKVLFPELVSAVGSQRFLREIEIVAGLTHPHILPLLDSGEVDGLLYYAMPVVAAGSLRDRLNRERHLPIDEALRITRDIADALSYAHARGIVHRDIKPSNIMLGSDGARVSDFGIALVLQDVSSDRLTASGFTPGSPEYMSVEQASGDGLVDERSDIYSLGCLLFEMLTGEPPFTGSAPQAVLAKKLMEPVPSPRVLRDSVPEHVERAVMIALAKSPADRFRTTQEFRQALSGDFGDRVFMDPATTSATTPGSTTNSPRLIGALAAALAGVGALLTTVGFLTTRVYDVKLKIPLDLTPSRTDFLTIGAKALFPAFFYCFAAAVAYAALRLAWSGMSAGLGHVPGVGGTIERLRQRSTDAWHKVWRPANLATIANIYFLGGIVIAVGTIFPFRDLLRTLISTDSDALTCSYRTLHRTYQITMPLLTAGLAIAWYGFFRYQRIRHGTGAKIAVAKWGGLSWVVVVAIVMTLPWRLLWDNTYPRALLDGELAYVVIETEADLVVYMPSTGSTNRIRIGTDPRLERLGTVGYLFEGSELFSSPSPGCW